MDQYSEEQQYLLASPYYGGFGIRERLSAVRKQFLESFKNLPPAIQNILVSVHTADAIWSLAQIDEFSEMNAQILAKIVRKVATGELFIKDMSRFVAVKLGIDEARAKQMSDKIMQEVFQPAREDIKKIQSQNFADRLQKEINLPSPEVNKNNIIDLRSKTSE